MLSVDGAIRVVSDEFSISLLNPTSELYKVKADKYSKLVRQSFSTFLNENVILGPNKNNL